MKRKIIFFFKSHASLFIQFSLTHLRRYPNSNFRTQKHPFTISIISLMNMRKYVIWFFFLSFNEPWSCDPLRLKFTTVRVMHKEPQSRRRKRDRWTIKVSSDPVPINQLTQNGACFHVKPFVVIWRSCGGLVIEKNREWLTAVLIKMRAGSWTCLIKFSLFSYSNLLVSIMRIKANYVELLMCLIAAYCKITAIIVFLINCY